MSDPFVTTLEALQQYRGDNLARARAAFRGLPDSVMDSQYGASGRTRREILAGYEEHDAMVDEAVAWVKERA